MTSLNVIVLNNNLHLKIVHDLENLHDFFKEKDTSESHRSTTTSEKPFRK